MIADLQRGAVETIAIPGHADGLCGLTLAAQRKREIDWAKR
jgi:hypothetical protein